MLSTSFAYQLGWQTDSGDAAVRMRFVCAVLGTAVTVALAGTPDLPRPSPVPVADYVQYWAASRVTFSGGNPYDWNQLLEEERQAEPGLPTPVVMWNPPWAIAVAALPSVLPYSLSRSVWVFACSFVLVASSAYLWNYWGKRRGNAVAIGATTVLLPSSIFVLVMGQMSPVMLAGVVGFLYFERCQRFMVAGACAAVTLVKPQVVYLFWTGLVCWSWVGKNWRFLTGVTIALAVMSAVPMLGNPRVFYDYLLAVITRPPDYFVTPTVGTLLRLLVGWNHAWLMAVAPLAGLAWFARHWQRNGRYWAWSTEISLILAMSVVTSPYAWLFDQVILLPLVLAAVYCQCGSPLSN
jgi:hypothetical protein